MTRVFTMTAALIGGCSASLASAQAPANPMTPNPPLHPTCYGELRQASARTAAIRVCGSRHSGTIHVAAPCVDVATWILSGWSAIWKLVLPNHPDGPETAFWGLVTVSAECHSDKAIAP